MQNYNVQSGYMPSFGEQLANARKSAGLSLEAISECSKLSVRYLRALEENRFDLLPGGVLGRGVARAYFSCAHLPADEWMPRFEEAFVQSGVVEKEEVNLTRYFSSYSRKRTRKDKSYYWLLWIAALLVLAASAWLVWARTMHRHEHVSRNAAAAAFVVRPSASATL